MVFSLKFYTLKEVVPLHILYVTAFSTWRRRKPWVLFSGLSRLWAAPGLLPMASLERNWRRARKPPSLTLNFAETLSLLMAAYIFGKCRRTVVAKFFIVHIFLSPRKTSRLFKDCLLIHGIGFRLERRNYKAVSLSSVFCVISAKECLHGLPFTVGWVEFRAVHSSIPSTFALVLPTLLNGEVGFFTSRVPRFVAKSSGARQNTCITTDFNSP